jgi:hypothetical protein
MGIISLSAGQRTGKEIPPNRSVPSPTRSWRLLSQGGTVTEERITAMRAFLEAFNRHDVDA